MPLALPPELSTPESAVDFLDLLPAEASSPNVSIDFRALNFAKPCATLLVADGLRAFLADRNARGLATHILLEDRQGASSYLGHIGFFEHIGHAHGKAPGEAFGSRWYVPLTVIKRAELALAANGRKIQDAVLETSEQLSRTIFDDESQRDQLTYCFQEIIRNVFEHADTDRCTVMAQKFKYDRVEIAITDSGCGIRASLGGDYLTRPPVESLMDALRPGVSRVRGQQSQDRWDNTGYGLYVMSRLGKETGSFTIASSGCLLTMTGLGVYTRQALVKGTAIRLLVNVSGAEYFPNRLKQIVEEGEAEEEIALRDGTPRSASKSTRMSKSKQ